MIEWYSRPLIPPFIVRWVIDLFGIRAHYVSTSSDFKIKP